ncbi:D-hexose-6-phosphate mutarotase [Bacterioplanes sanyensis]|uniref:Putative glucose-6-phosphate 1-epimerase n=1 Tax=Bacterioplanes sanyensis TaxID=1249553 RepID=A0A222FPL3_9GAMM|nr:D-hexose-6-phosphate mutarotase [Bacterioplanes sanyensis]ASP40466.1 D-hexose-6-phosphate mutarotase [Bacterioplanes sanyensis]
MNLQRSTFCRPIRRQQLDIIGIQHPLFSAELALQGAQLLNFQPQGDPPWLWLSEQADYLQGSSVRGGIPVCWPWFGDLRRNPQAVQQHFQGNGSSAPAHGLARTALWQLSALKEDVHQVDLTLATQQLSRLWPTMSAQLHITLRRDRLVLRLNSRNDSPNPVTISQALHTYLPVEDIRTVTVGGLQGNTYIDALDDWQSRQQQGLVRFSAETDRIYHSQGPLRLQSGQHSRTLVSNSASTVVWNPWINKSQRLSQFHPDAWQRMVCIETTNAAFDCVALQPGQQHSLQLQLT